jgi:septal ring factor EnvC (AmiA/AmiB activator)
VSGGTVGSVGTGGHGSGRTRTGGASDGEGRTQGSGRSTGVDFLVPVGTAVHAVTAGTVVSADREGSGGLTVVIRQADGDYAVYGELSQALVSPGQTVTGGRLVGLSGTLGDDGRAGLRFEVRTAPEGGTALDPLAYLREHGVSV